MRASRLRSCIDALGVVVCELVLLGFFVRSAPLLGSVDMAHVGSWLATSSPQAAFTALTRLLGTVVAGWLLASTVLYGAAALTGKHALRRGLRLVTLPVLRRVMDAATAASVVVASFGSAAVAASAASVPRPAPVVRPLSTPRPLDRGTVERVTSARASVSVTAVDRHLPHPGTVAHAALAKTVSAVAAVQVPSEANGFAGLAPGTKVVVVQPGDCLSVLAERHLGDWRFDSQIEELNWGRPQADGRALNSDHWIYPGWVLVMPSNATGTFVVGHPAVPEPGESGRDHAPLSVRSSQAGPVGLTAAPSAARSSHGQSKPRPAGSLPADPPRTVPLPTSTLASSDPAPSSQTDGPSHPPADPELAALVGAGAIAAGGIVWRLDRSRREQLHDRPTGGAISRNAADVEAAERRARAIASPEAMRWVDLGLRYLSGLVEGRSRDGAAEVPSVALAVAGQRGLRFVVSPPARGPLGWFSPVDTGVGLVLDPEVTLEDLEALAGDRWTAWPAMVSVGENKDGAVLLNLEHAGSLSVEGSPAVVEAALSRFALELVSQPWADEMLAGVHALGDCPLDAALARVDRVSAAEAPELAEKLSRVSAAHQEVVGTVCLSAVRALACEGLPNVAIAFAGTPTEAVERLCDAAVPQRSGVVLVGAGPYPGAQWRLALSAESEGRLEGHVGGEPVSLRLELGQELGEPSLLARAFAPVTAPLDAGTVQPGPVEVEVAGGPAPGQGGTAVGPESAASEASAASRVPEDEHRPAGSVVDGSGPGYLAPGQDVVVLMDEARAAGGGEASHEPGSGTRPSGRSLGVGDQERGAGLLAERGDAEIRLLGPVDVVGGEMGALEASRRMAALAVLAYVASHDHPVSAEELASSLWPLDACKDNLGGPQRKTVMNVISRARALLGYGAGGRERLVHSPLGYKLTSDVTCDWARFGRMVSMARSQRPTEAAATLRGALELVRGEPFGGALSSQFFEWASSEHLDLAMSARVVDAAEALGEMALAAEDLGTVTWAVDKGLQLDPAREELFRLWMHALGRGGRPAKVDEVYRRLRVVLQRRVHPLQEPQPESREVWRMYMVAEVAGV